MSTACSKYADEVSGVKRQIEEGVAALTATVILGAVGAVLAFGVTEAAILPTAEAFAGFAARLIATLGAADWVTDIGLDLTTTIGIIDDAAADSVASVTSDISDAIASKSYAPGLGKAITLPIAGAAGGTGGATLSAAANELITGKSLTRSELEKDLFESGAEGSLDGVLGKLGDLSATQLSNTLDNTAQAVAADDPQLFMSLKALSRQVVGINGKISASILASAASQLVSAQQITAQNLAGDQLQDRLMESAGHDEAGKG